MPASRMRPSNPFGFGADDDVFITRFHTIRDSVQQPEGVALRDIPTCPVKSCHGSHQRRLNRTDWVPEVRCPESIQFLFTTGPLRRRLRCGVNAKARHQLPNVTKSCSGRDETEEQVRIERELKRWIHSPNL